MCIRDRCIVVLSADTNLSDIVSMRQMTAEIVYESSTGICVPKEALHIDDDGTYVYIVLGTQASKISVEIIGEMDNYYILESSTGELREGTDVIIKGKGLYDGKIVR